MEKEHSRAEIILTRKIERVLSDILSDKHDCKVKIRVLPEEVGDASLNEDEELHMICDSEKGSRLVIMKKGENGGADDERRSTNRNHEIRICST